MSNNLITRPSLGLGFGGNSTLPMPLVDLSNPSAQSVAPAGMKFDEWTFYMKFDDTGAPASTQKLFNLQLDNTNYIFLHYLSNSNLQLVVERDNTVQSYVFAANDYLLGQGEASIILSGRQDDVVIAINGIIMYEIEDIDVPAGVPVGLGVGQNYVGSQSFVRPISAFQFFNKRLPNYSIKALGRHNDFGISYSYDSDRLVHFKMGQSNSLGPQATAPLPAIYTNLARMQIITKDGALDSSYQDPSSSNGGGALFSNFTQNGVFSSGGVEIDAIAAAQPDKDVAVMHIDRGDTGLVDNTGNFRWLSWNLGVVGERKLNGPAYQAVLMQMIGALHGTPFSRTWWQGEKDAANAGISQFQYRSELVKLLQLFDEYVSVPNIVVGLHDEPSSPPGNWSAIQAAQAEINSYYSNAHHVSAAGATVAVDELHLDQAGYISVGADIAAQINALT